MVEAETSPGKPDTILYQLFYDPLKLNKLPTCVRAVTCIIHDVEELVLRESAPVFVIFITCPTAW